MKSPLALSLRTRILLASVLVQTAIFALLIELLRDHLLIVAAALILSIVSMGARLRVSATERDASRANAGSRVETTGIGSRATSDAVTCVFTRRRTR